MNKDVRITGLTLRHSTNKDGFERLGYFDCSIDGVQYNGLTLAGKPDGQFVAWSPLLNCIGNRKAFSFTDSALRRAIADAASEAFRRLAGTDSLMSDFKVSDEINVSAYCWCRVVSMAGAHDRRRDHLYDG